MDCIFCKIIDRSAPAEILYETDTVISFLDILPVNLGHALVVPKGHYRDLTEVPPVILGELFSTVQRLSPVITGAVQAEGFNIIGNNGRAAGQTVFHCHIHIIPRYHDDKGRFRRPQFLQYNNGSFREYGKNLRESIKKESSTWKEK
ncbi:MAG: HIT family protein [Ignavibacteriaceae bacterium]|nr:HIT family protein [Ignavibacteriaceae bacterium]